MQNDKPWFTLASRPVVVFGKRRVVPQPKKVQE